MSSGSDLYDTVEQARHHGIPATAIISEERRQALLGFAPGMHVSDNFAKRTMQFVVRVLRSWPALLATHSAFHLPPMIHKVQVADGIPKPLVNCFALCKMWYGQADGSDDIVLNKIMLELERLFQEVSMVSIINGCNATKILHSTQATRNWICLPLRSLC